MREAEREGVVSKVANMKEAGEGTYIDKLGAIKFYANACDANVARACSERKNWIGDTFKADALEMEGASVAVVCNALEIPFFILRAISDSADGSADIDFDTFLASSAKISADFILDMVEAIE